ncbi:formyltetrahydrofolate deformylase [Jatrophihabitans sp.]|uniref:formyltetrahydrofolate deformylase n=1 Tax=Jatrophihabitans sp. TaxID=1932789 RepID=UPI0030C6701F|nr:formyltetrahydrofolate deformylase [Jatrophihabitans sp.]
MAEFVLTLSCADAVGIVRAVAGFCADRGGNILDSQQFGDVGTGRFFMRVHFTHDGPDELLRQDFAPVAEPFAMTWQLRDVAVRPRILIMVSKQDHCLNDLLYRYRIGALPAEIVAVVSNHPDAEPMARAAGLPFHHLPVTPETKPAQEAALLELVQAEGVELVVLARYMQVLSDSLCTALAGRAINIHHSFLPGFKGARPYHQAFDRGVKLIGATAHYVTAELDEGPIIEQEVARVDHGVTPERLAAVGRDLESQALARAVTWHVDQRVLLNGSKTVIFR